MISKQNQKKKYSANPIISEDIHIDLCGGSRTRMKITGYTNDHLMKISTYPSIALDESFVANFSTKAPTLYLNHFVHS